MATLDYLVLEGTFGFKRLPPGDGHMDVYSICETVERLIEQGSVVQTTKIYITHISHHSGCSHDEYEAYLQEQLRRRIQLAWDGCEFNPKHRFSSEVVKLANL